MFSTPFTFLKFAGSGPSPYDPNAQAFFTATGITDTTIKNAVNTLVVDLKAANLWSKFYAIYPFVGNTANTCKYNLVNPVDSDAAFRLTFAGTWGFSPYGIMGNSTDTYANTHWNPGTNLTDYSSMSYGLYCMDNQTTVQSYINWLISVADDTYSNPMSASIDLGVNTNYAFWDPGSESYRFSGSAADPKGLIWIDQTSYTSRKIYRNDSIYLSSTQDNSSTASNKTYRDFVIGCQSSGNLGYLYFTGNTYSFGFIADAIPYADATTFYTIVEAFQTALGRSASQTDQQVMNYVNQLYKVGGTLTSTEQSAVSQLVSDLKADGIWSKLDVFLPILGTDPEAMVLNLVDPKNSTWGWTYFGTPTLSSTGILGNGTDAAVLSNWGLNENLVKSQVNDSHWSCYAKYNGGGSGNYLNGVIDTDNSPYSKGGIGSFAGSTYGGIYGDAYAFAGGPADSAQNGFVYAENLATDTNQIYINNSAYSAVYPTTRAFSSGQKIAMLALAWTTQTNGLYQDFSTSEIRSWSMGAGLTPTQRTALYNDVIDFQTALSRLA